MSFSSNSICETRPFRALVTRANDSAAFIFGVLTRLYSELNELLMTPRWM